MLKNTSRILIAKNKMELGRFACPIGKSQCCILKQTKPRVYFRRSLFHWGVEWKKGELVLTNYKDITKKKKTNPNRTKKKKEKERKHHET